MKCNARAALDASLPWPPLGASMPSCLVMRIVPLCKTGAVMRFGEHFCAADFYKQGNSRGFCVESFFGIGFWGGWICDQRRAARGGNGGQWAADGLAATGAVDSAVPRRLRPPCGGVKS